MSDPMKTQYVGYVFLSHGPKHTKSPLIKRAGAKKQIQIIEAAVSRHDGNIGAWISDYARSPNGMESLGNLRNTLEHLRKRDATGRLLVDDIGRLFKQCKPKFLNTLYDDLLCYSEIIFDLKRGKLLKDFTQYEMKSATLSGQKTAAERFFKPPSSSTHSTHIETNMTEARAISAKARSIQADQYANAIIDLRDEVSADNSPISNSELARLANKRGLKTSRGGNWSDVAVRRALERLNAKS